jgi:copper chaperone CopZ
VEYYIHTVPGRLRLKSPFFKNVATHDDIKKMLASLSGIATTDFNAITGSIVVYYNPAQIKVNEIVNTFQRSGYYDPSKAITNDQYIQKATSKVGNIVSKAVFGAMAEKAFEGSALSFLAILL